jgi:hypothetical protein
MMLQRSPAGRLYGRHKDTPDSRDKVLRLPVTPITAHDESAWLGPVRDQQAEGSCVGHGWAGHADWLFRKYGPHHFALNLSPQFVYYKCRELDGTLPDDAGSQVRSGAKVFNQFGIAPEPDMIYGMDTMNTPPTAQAMKDALLYKGGAYHTLLTLDDMKSCLASGYCFVDGIDVYESFESEAVADSGEVSMPKPNEQSLGGHCTLTFGFDDEHVCADGSVGALHKRNSWGSDWGENGNFWLPYGFVTQGLLTDAWILHLGPAWKAAQ